MRKTKKIKHELYYFAAKKLQKEEADYLYLHMSLNIHWEDLFNFIEFIYWFKKQKFKNIGQIGRTHIQINKIYKKEIDKYYNFAPAKDKDNPEKIEYWIPYVEPKAFSTGEANFFEFISINDLKERYQKNIIDYITKTIISQYNLKVIKMGVMKNYNEHHVKALLKSANNSDFKRDIELIRSICKKVYTTTRFPVSYHAYQRNYMKLIKQDKNFKKFYNVIKACETGILELKNNTFYYYGKEVI